MNHIDSDSHVILIVDDDPSILNLIADVMSRYAFKTLNAGNGETALRIAKNEKPDIILLDVMMPGIDGFETCRRLKKNIETKEIPVIFMTVLTDTLNIVTGFKLGGVDYVAKPIEQEELVARITTHLTIQGLKNGLKCKNVELAEINRHLEKRINEETEKRRQSELMLFQQLKLVEIGEIVGTIAHKWRQPLNVLGLLIQDMEAAYDSDEINKKYIEQLINDSMGQINTMCKEIEEFRSFYRPSKVKCSFDILSTIKEVLPIISSTLKNNNINIKIDSGFNSPLSLWGCPNSFKQALLIIINNSKETILKTRQQGSFDNDKKGEIFIAIVIEEKNLIIKIKDNAGGTSDDTFVRLLGPLHKDNEGEGIGLYISKIIIEKDMHGKLYWDDLTEGGTLNIVLKRGSTNG